MILLPTPQSMQFSGGEFPLPSDGLIAVAGADPAALYPIARILQLALVRKADLRWEIAAGNAAPAEQVRALLSLAPSSLPHAQGYILEISPQRIQARASTPAGLFYAVQTLRQLLVQHTASLPTLRIHDWPDYPNRGVMLDISRDKVPAMETLYTLIDLLAGWKINQVQLYTEHTFAYRCHPEVWAEASPLTGEQILALDAYCRERFIELVPNQNTFGHMQPWLVHARYRHLAECPDGCDTRWGRFDLPFSLNPTDPGSLELVRGLLDELLPHFSSRQVNVGCDETVDLGLGRSREVVTRLGIGQVYFDFLMQIYREVTRRGRTMQYWGDIIMEHPELTAGLPQDAIALEWGYEADHPFDQHGAAFAASGVPFYVCPGTSSWNSIAGRSDNTLGNLRNAAASGLKHGAVGYLITDWGDNGHWQPLPVSFLGFAYGAGLAWGYAANLDMDVPRALDVHAFGDGGGVMGRLAYDLGNVYLAPGIPQHNRSALFGVLQANPHTIRQYLPPESEWPDLAKRFHETLQRIEAVMTPLPQAEMERPDAALIRREFAWAAEMLRHACRRALWVMGESEEEYRPERLAAEAQGLIDEFREVWHARNRPGGFRESLARMQRLKGDYS